MPRKPAPQVATTAYVTELTSSPATYHDMRVEITPAGIAALAEPESTDVVEEVIESPRHALDHCPIGSKLVGTEQGVVLARPDGGEGRGSESILPKTDLAGKLPVGALIQKIGEGAYRGVQLDSGREDVPALITATAHEAVSQFVKYFHG